MNRVILVGRIVKDPELRQSQSGVPFVYFTLAINRLPNAQGERTADFITCVAFRNQAQNLANFVKHGNLLGVEGRIQSRQVTQNDNTTRTIMEVICDTITFLEPKQKNNDYNGMYQQPNNNQGNFNQNQSMPRNNMNNMNNMNNNMGSMNNMNNNMGNMNSMNNNMGSMNNMNSMNNNMGNMNNMNNNMGNMNNMNNNNNVNSSKNDNSDVIPGDDDFPF